MSNFSIAKASKIWGISRTTIYKKLELWELSQNHDKTISMVEMIRVFGEVKLSKTVQDKKEMNKNVHLWTNETEQLKLELERQKTLNEQLLKQLNICSQRVQYLENALTKSLDNVTELTKMHTLEAPKPARKKIFWIF